MRTRYIKKDPEKSYEMPHWVKLVEPELTKGLILCPNHEKFVDEVVYEILKVDKRRDRHAPDKHGGT